MGDKAGRKLGSQYHWTRYKTNKMLVCANFHKTHVVFLNWGCDVYCDNRDITGRIFDLYSVQPFGRLNKRGICEVECKVAVARSIGLFERTLFFASLPFGLESVWCIDS